MDKPLTITFGYKTPTGATFITQKGECTIQSHIKEIFCILPFCNGLRTINEIAKAAGMKLRVTEQLLRDLEELGIVADSSELYKSYLTSTQYESLYRSAINPNEITNLRSTVSIARGTTTAGSPGQQSQLETILRKRKTTRTFSSTRSTSQADLDYILGRMYFINGHSTVPSAGALYPLTFNVLILNTIGGYSQGVYSYSAVEQVLEPVKNFAYSIEDVRYALGGEDVATNADAIILISADTSLHTKKYSNRGFIYTLLESGHVAQNIQLLCAEKEIGVLEYGGFNSTRFREIFSLAQNQTPIIPLIISPYEKDEKDTSYELPLEQMKKLWHLMEKYVGDGKLIEWIDAEELTYADHYMPRVSSLASFRSIEKKAEDKKMKGFSFATGYSSLEANIKTIAEAIERLASGHLRYDVADTYQNLTERCDPINPDQLWPIDGRWYKRREISARYEKFSPTKKYQWIEGTDLSDSSKRLIIIDQVFYPLYQEKLKRKLICNISSSGVAAHFDREEARVRALYELIERDAITSLWFTKRPFGQIPLKLIPADIKQRASFWLDEKGSELVFLDITTDQVPTVLICIRRTSYPYFVVGAAASHSYNKALMKAFDELEATLLSWLKERNKSPAKVDIESPHHHGLYYANKKRAETDWLFSEGQNVNELRSFEGEMNALIKQYRPIEVVMKYPVDEYDLWVIRIISPVLLPLNFGLGNEPLAHERFSVLDYPSRWSKYPNPPHFFP